MNYKTWTRCAARTGRKIDELMLPDRIEDYDNHCTTLYDGVFDGDTHYLVNGEPTERPTQSSAIDVIEIVVSEGEQATITDMPDPCVVNVNGPTGYQSVTVMGGVLQFSAAIPGDYTLQLESFPFLSMEFAIHAV